jgi:hypothetical protein
MRVGGGVDVEVGIGVGVDVELEVEASAASTGPSFGIVHASVAPMRMISRISATQRPALAAASMERIGFRACPARDAEAIDADSGSWSSAAVARRRAQRSAARARILCGSFSKTQAM